MIENINTFTVQVQKQEGQVVMKRSPEFCLKLIYTYLLKAGHFPGDTCDGYFWPQISRLYDLWFQTRRLYHVSLY